jgi:glycosyltransferase involved in cell wall biosynthesis
VAEISVVIPCYNYGRFLASAIDSVLAQKHANVEVIVVDDGSTDATPAVAARYPEVRYLCQRNLGESEARNHGGTEATGEFILFLDADDQLTPEAIGTSVQRLREQPTCAFAYGHQQFVDAEGAVLPSNPERTRMFQTCLRNADAYAYMLRMNYPLRAPGAVLYRAELVRRIGGFAPEFRTGADLDLNLRIAREHRVCCNDRVVLLTRIHGANATGNSRMMLQGAVRVQRRQRPYVDQHPEYEGDYEIGLRLARSYWGARLAKQIAEDVGTGKIGSAARNLWTMARFARSQGAVAAAKLLVMKVRKTS